VRRTTVRYEVDRKWPDLGPRVWVRWSSHPTLLLANGESEMFRTGLVRVMKVVSVETRTVVQPRARGRMKADA
jgi:hypothetical protein